VYDIAIHWGAETSLDPNEPLEAIVETLRRHPGSMVQHLWTRLPGPLSADTSLADYETDGILHHGGDVFVVGQKNDHRAAYRWLTGAIVGSDPLECARDVRVHAPTFVAALEADGIEAPRFLVTGSATDDGGQTSLTGPIRQRRGQLASNRPMALTLDQCWHSSGFRELVWFGREFRFNERQARVVELLWNAWKAGRIGVPADEIAGAVAGAALSFSVGHTFRDHSAWTEKVIVKPAHAYYALSSDRSPK